MDYGTMAARRWVEIYEQQGAREACLHSKLLTGKFAEARRRVGEVKLKATYGCPMDPDRFLEVEMGVVYDAVSYWLNKEVPINEDQLSSLWGQEECVGRPIPGEVVPEVSSVWVDSQ